MRNATLLAALVLTWPSTAAARADHTYGIVVRAYCPPGPAGPCGHADDQAMEAYYQDQMVAVNQAWRPHGVSFRLQDVIIARDNYFSAIEGTPDIDVPGTEEGDRIRELHDLAAQNPEVLTLFVLPRPDLCWSAVAPYQFPDYPSVFHGFFCGPWGDGWVLAHELGHHFCLPHPFTFDDPADSPDGVNWDGDGIADTPLDAGPLENDPDAVGTDMHPDGGVENQHVWCDVPTVMWADMGGPRETQCDPRCRRSINGAGVPEPIYPDGSLIMGYYGECQGPYLDGGERVEGFSPGQVDAVQACIQDFAPRQGLTNLCAGRGGDADHDGFCDADDPCPHLPHVPGDDPDGDGVPSGCDNCPDDPNPDQSDIDGDQAGDVCDEDRDNDGCFDAADGPNGPDLRPDDATMRVGTQLLAGCDAASQPRMAFEGVDFDNDALLDCNDPDDDNDGTPDELDPCPRDPTVGQGDDEAPCQTIGQVCPILPQTIDCGPGCGVLDRIDLVSRLNPYEVLVFDDIAVVGDTIHLGRTDAMTAGQVMHALSGQGFGPAAVDGPMALELRTLEARENRVLLEYLPSQLSFEPGTDGISVAVRVTADGVVAGTSWGVLLEPGDLASDSDGDGIPDPADRCITVADPRQDDSDGDGFGDACDPDLDQSGWVDAADIAVLEGCLGAQPGMKPLYGEPSLPSLLPDVQDEALAEGWRCRAADLDGDGQVTSADVGIAEGLLDGPPGPSGLAAGTEPDGDTGEPEPEPEPEPEVERGCGCATQDEDGLGRLFWIAEAVVRRR